MKINSVFNKTLLFVGAIVCTIGLQSCLDDDDNNVCNLPCSLYTATLLGKREASTSMITTSAALKPEAL